MVVLITLTAVLVVGGVVALLVYRWHIRNRWRKFVNSRLDDDDEIIAAGPSYPITHKYYKGLRGHPAYAANQETPSANVDAEGSAAEPVAGSSKFEDLLQSPAKSPVST